MKTIDYKKVFGCYLRNTRLRTGTINQDAYSGEVERGEHSVTLDKIEAVAAYMDVTVSELFLAIEKDTLN